MDGESGVFFQPTATVIPGPAHKFSGPTIGVHVVGLSPVFGNLYNVGVEEGYGDRLSSVLPETSTQTEGIRTSAPW